MSAKNTESVRNVKRNQDFTLLCEHYSEKLSMLLSIFESFREKFDKVNETYRRLKADEQNKDLMYTDEVYFDARCFTSGVFRGRGSIRIHKFNA